MFFFVVKNNGLDFFFLSNPPFAAGQATILFVTTVAPATGFYLGRRGNRKEVQASLSGRDKVAAQWGDLAGATQSRAVDSFPSPGDSSVRRHTASRELAALGVRVDERERAARHVRSGRGPCTQRGLTSNAAITQEEEEEGPRARAWCTNPIVAGEETRREERSALACCKYNWHHSSLPQPPRTPAPRRPTT